MALAITGNGRLRQQAGVLPARLALGASMVFHGTSKLRAPEPVGQGFESLGIRPGRAWAIATGAAETFAGIAAVLGIATRPAALAVLVTQVVAISKVHAPKGYDVMKGGMEYNLALIAIALGLLLAGPGDISAHQAAERLAEGRGARALWRRARPSLWMRAIGLLG